MCSAPGTPSSGGCGHYLAIANNAGKSVSEHCSAVLSLIPMPAVSYLPVDHGDVTHVGDRACAFCVMMAAYVDILVSEVMFYIKHGCVNVTYSDGWMYWLLYQTRWANW